MNQVQDGCEMCELEALLRARSGELRDILRRMIPDRTPEYKVRFDELIGVDTDWRILRGQRA